MTSTVGGRRLGAGLARAQLAGIPWATLGAGGRAAEHVRDDLTTMLFSQDGAAVDEAYSRIENP